MGLPVVSGLRAWQMALAGPPIYWYFSLYYILLSGYTESIVRILLIFLSLILSVAWGFLLNDLFDRKSDKMGPKGGRERGHELSLKMLSALVILTGGLSWLIVLVLGGNHVYKLVLLSGYVLSVLYSVPPVKLKARTYLGFIADSVMERPIPILVLFTFMGSFGFEMILFPILAELTWSVFKHQAADYDEDAAANVRTLAVAFGRDLSFKIVYKFLNPISVISVLVLIGIAWLRIPSLKAPLTIITVIIMIGVIASFLVGRSGGLSIYATVTDPPYIMFLNVAYKLLLLPVVSLWLALARFEYVPLVILLGLSLIPHIKYYARLGPMFLRALVSAQRSIN